MENRGKTDDVDKVVNDSSRDGIQEHDFADECPSELPSMAMSSSAPSGSSSPYASLQMPSVSMVIDHDGRDDVHAGRKSGIEEEEHALPSGPMQLLAWIEMMERPQVGSASNHNVAPGAFPVRSSRNTATNRAFRSPIRSYDSPGEFTNVDFKQAEGLPYSAVTGRGWYTVEAQRVSDGDEDGTVIVAEAQYVSTIDDRDIAHAGSVGDIKKWVHAPPSEPMQLGAGLGMVDSMGRPPVDLASDDDLASGAFPVQSARNTATSRTYRPPMSSYHSPGEFTNEEGGHTSAHDAFSVAT